MKNVNGKLSAIILKMQSISALMSGTHYTYCIYGLQIFIYSLYHGVLLVHWVVVDRYKEFFLMII